jgi:tRNA nucleotidyltransferase/poly(A) polymerase
LGLGEIVFRFLPTVPETIDMNRSVFMKLLPGEPVAFSLAVAAAVLCARIQAEKKEATSLLSRQSVSQSIRAMRQALRLSNAESDDAAEILENLSPLLGEPPPTLAVKKRFLARKTSAMSRALMDALATIGESTERIESLKKDWRTLETEDNAPVPLVSGDDLTSAGYQPGPAFKRILDALYDAQLEGRIKDKEQAMKMAREMGFSS